MYDKYTDVLSRHTVFLPNIVYFAVLRGYAKIPLELICHAAPDRAVAQRILVHRSGGICKNPLLPVSPRTFRCHRSAAALLWCGR